MGRAARAARDMRMDVVFIREVTSDPNLPQSVQKAVHAQTLNVEPLLRKVVDDIS